MIEQHFDIPFVGDLALREKQIQQNYRPIIAVHKWFARRPGTLFRALLLSEFQDAPVTETYYRSHQLPGLTVADPFMGGGLPLLEANRLGCDVVGCDINPMAYWIVREELGSIDRSAYEQAAAALRETLRTELGALHETRCTRCSATVPVKYFLWLKVATCPHCATTYDLAPGYVIAENRRHPNYVVVCRSCGALTELRDKQQPGRCGSCQAELRLAGTVTRRAVVCPGCGRRNPYPGPDPVVPSHRLIALEYHCPACKPTQAGRFFKAPEPEDLARVAAARERLGALDLRFVPDEVIPPGDETDRLLRWGYRRYRDLFNERQLGAEQGEPAFSRASTRNVDELTGNANMGRGLDHFTEGLAATFARFTAGLKPGRPFAFTFHHNQLEAYQPVAVALLDAGLVCTTALPCPAEMGASIHINGTRSSIVDTVFVCRTTGTLARRHLLVTPTALASYVADDHARLTQVYTPTRGDLRCILFGHLTRLATWCLRPGWDRNDTIEAKLASVRQFFAGFALAELMTCLEPVLENAPLFQAWQAQEPRPEAAYGELPDHVSF